MAAKQIVKCPYCEANFDRVTVEFVQIGRRYAHKTCYDAAGGVSPFKSQNKVKIEDPDLSALKEYIGILLGDHCNWAMTTKYIKKFKDEYGYSYSGMLKSLKYFYEVKKNPIDKANGSIGIIPYVYQDAFNYYLAIWKAQQANEQKKFTTQIKEFFIKTPKPKTVARKILEWEFDFDEEE